MKRILLIGIFFFFFVPTVNAEFTRIYLSFDGVDDYMNVSSHATMNTTGSDAAWEIWMQVDNDDIVDYNQYVFVEKYDEGQGFYGIFENNDTEAILLFTIITAGDLRVNLVLNKGEITSYLDNTWHVWTFLYDSTAHTISLYVDGLFIATSAVGSIMATYDTPVDLYIGASNWAGTPIDFFPANFSDFKWYGRQLNTTEMAYVILNDAIPMNQTDLIVWLKINEGIGDTAADSVNSNDATLQPNYPSNAPTWYGAAIVTTPPLPSLSLMLLAAVGVYFYMKGRQ